MAVALIALFIAMGGTALAAHHYLIESTKQINPKVLKKLRGKTGPEGPRGLQGLQGPQGATGGTGAPGANLTAETPLPSGQSESGTFSAGGGWDAGNGKGAFGYIGEGVTFTQPLATPIAETHILDLRSAAEASKNPNCPGLGKAARGYLCLYNYVAEDVSGGYGYSGTEYESSPEPGIFLYWPVKEAGVPYVGGEYTVTAP
jgi:hypothetical protein